MSLVSLAVDGLLQRWPGILNPVLRVPAKTTRSPYPRQAFPKPAPTYERRLWGSDNYDRFENQRFSREPRRAAPTPTPVKTYGGFGAMSSVYIEPEAHIKTFSGPADFGNLPPKVPVKTFEAAEKTLRTPIKTF